MIYVSVFMPVPGCFDHGGLVVQFDIGIVIPLTSFFFLNIADAIFWFHIHFWNICSISVKYAIGILIGIELNL